MFQSHLGLRAGPALLNERPIRFDLTEAAGGDRVQGGHRLPRHLRGAIVALGNFDGFHLGHQAVARRARALADERGVAALVATFDPHPVRLFRPDHAPFRLTSIEQRQRAICAAGMDAMMVFDFNQHMADASAVTFVHDWLVDVGGVVTGKDFFFGKARAGDVATLQRLAQQNGLTCSAVDPVMQDGSVVSSTRIRGALKNGDCEAATRLMTRPFAFQGELATGIGFDPDLLILGARLDLGEYASLRRGLYAIRVRIPGRTPIDGLCYQPEPVSGAARILDLFLVGSTASDIGRSVEIEPIAHLYDSNRLLDPHILMESVRDRWLQRCSLWGSSLTKPG